ncbi:MAG: hypothetical protein HON55_03415 [Legionellales bacterium]|mgnify:CR=1 FL=1|jgi:hypothetical protein|nr:hypothetical protein [Legionellales bacterium]
MKKKLYFAVVCVSTLFLESCSNIQVEPYSSAKADVFKMKNILKNKLAVTGFSNKNMAESSIPCRVGAIQVSLPATETFSSYIENSFVEFLIDADKYDPGSKHALKGEIRKVDFDTITGNWHLTGDFMLNNKMVTIDKDYGFSSAFDDIPACKNTAKAFNQVVSKFVYDTLVSFK